MLFRFNKISDIRLEYTSDTFSDDLIKRINSKSDKKQSQAAYILLNEILSAEYGLSVNKLLFTENGKPYLKNGPYLSVSHSGEYVCAAVSDVPVGVDIERFREFNLKILDRFFSRREKRYILKKNTSIRFFRLWTLKEAVIKMQGSTIADLPNIKFSIVGNRIFYKKYKLHTEICENCMIAVCSSEKTDK